MKYIFTRFLFILTLVVQAQTNVNDSVIEVKTYFNIEDSFDYQITTNDLRIEGLDTVQNDFVKFKTQINVLDLYQDQYTIHWHIYDIENSNQNITRNPLSFLDELDIYYTIDTNGKFIDFQKSNYSIIQFQSALEKTEDRFTDKPNVLKILDEVAETYNSLDKVNGLFEKEIIQFHYFFGLGKFGLQEEPKVFKTYIDNLFNENPTPATTTYLLREISPYLNNYVMNSTSIADAEWLKASWFSYLENIAKQNNLPLPNRDEVDSNILYNVDTMNRIKDTGWISYSVQVKKVNFMNTFFSQKRTIEILP